MIEKWQKRIYLLGRPPQQGQSLTGIKEFFRQNLLILVFFALGLVFLVIGIFFLFSFPQNKESGIIFEEGAKTSAGKIKVDVGGAVVRPQVYEINDDARIQDVLILAGGLSSSADRGWVAKNLNLAAKLADGAKIYIPGTDEKIAVGGQTPGSGSTSLEGKININTASAEELDKLPGVGPVTARKIISSRPYRAPEDLVNKKIISNPVFLKLKEQITLW